MKVYWFLFLILNFSFPKYVNAKGIFSKVGASCVFVASNFTSFPFNCEMPDLAFKCRCQDPSFLGTVTNCIDSYSKDPHDLSKGYSQLIEICKAQGGKTWELIDLVKLNENATNFLINYDLLPKPLFKASLIWKAKKIFDIQTKNKDILDKQNFKSQKQQQMGMKQQDKISDDQLIVFNPYSGTNKENQFLKKNTGMLKDGKIVGFEKIPNFDDIKEIENIGIDNLLESPRNLLYNPVIVSDESYNISYNSVSKLMDQRNLATIYGYYIYIYWASVMVIAILVNIAKWTSPYYNNKIGKTRLALWCKSKIICPQIFKPSNILTLSSNSIAKNTIKELVDGPMGMFIGDKRVKAQKIQSKLLSDQLLDENNQDKLEDLGNKLKKIKKVSMKTSKSSKFYINFKNNLLHSIYTMPVRMHALIIIGYIILNIVFCCINYEIVYPNAVFTCRKGQRLVSIADRTGIIGTVQLPLLFLFSSRNNFLIFTTGLSYRTFQMFHKWTSRIVFILLLLHCAFYLTFVNVRGDYIQRWGLLKWKCANTAFAAISITFLFSFFRRYFYEWFKSSHRILLIIFSIGSWYHCLTLGWTEYLITAFSIWGVDYLIRFGKLISSGGILKGQCKVIFDTNTKEVHSIKIVTNHSGWWRPYPSCYCWITILRYDLFWESHPFTVVSATAESNYNQLVFVIRVKNGLTKRLANYISKFPNGECDINLLVEGPYGNNIPFKQYEQSILVAGGVGMAVIYSIVLDIAQIYRAQELRGKKNNNNNFSNGNYKNKYISLIWLIPNFESLISFKNEIETLHNFKDLINIQIFITREVSDNKLQTIINESKLINPLNVLSSSYEKGGFREFANALIKSSTLCDTIDDINLIDENRTGNVISNCSDYNLNCINENTGITGITLESKEGIDHGNYIDNSELDQRLRQGIFEGENKDENKDESKDENEDENGNNIKNDIESTNVDIIQYQRKEEIDFLKWIINQNGEQISISFEDKPFLQDELTELMVNICGDGCPTSLISCGPTSMNADVRFSVVKCLEKKLVVDYYEEELLW